MQPVLGQFAFDLYGRVSYMYAAIVLALGFLVFRSVVDSNFGKSLVGIRENESRMHALGTPVDARLRTAFVISAALAGIAGGAAGAGRGVRVAECRERRVFRRDPDHVDPGGAGRRYGAFLGAPLYVFMQDYLAQGGSDELVSLDWPVAPGDRVSGAGRPHRVGRRAGAARGREAFMMPHGNSLTALRSRNRQSVVWVPSGMSPRCVSRSTVGLLWRGRNRAPES